MSKGGIKINGLDSLFKKIREALSELNEADFYDLAKYTADRIVFKARTGTTMASGKEEPHKPLSPRYVKQRERWSKNGGQKLDPTFFSPKRSNLTLSGQYLKSIRPTEVRLKELKFVIEPTGNRSGENLSNKELAEYLRKMGRSIFGVDNQTRSLIRRKVITALRNRIRKNLLRE